MKTKTLTTLLLVGLLISSCGHSVLKTKEDAIKFLENHKFYDESASVSGQSSGGASLKTAFSLNFSNGNAIIGGETMPYTITEERNSSYCGGPGYSIKFCGSQRYAYGGCIECTLCSGVLNDGSKTKFGPSLNINGSYIKAHFSYVTDDAITKK